VAAWAATGIDQQHVARANRKNRVRGFVSDPLDIMGSVRSLIQKQDHISTAAAAVLLCVKARAQLHAEHRSNAATGVFVRTGKMT
jgi:hypothetical protein